MNTSLSWIKMYVPDLDVTAQEYTDAMTLTGTKVEGFEKLDADLDKIVIGQIEKIEKLAENVNAGDMHELMYVYELKERLTVCKSVIAHLFARKETRWHSFDENLDYPKKSGDWLKYVNSKMEDGKITVFTRKLVGREEHYEHHDESGALQRL